jgi:hypothetical protein
MTLGMVRPSLVADDVGVFPATNDPARVVADLAERHHEVTAQRLVGTSHTDAAPLRLSSTAFTAFLADTLTWQAESRFGASAELIESKVIVFR